MKENKSPGVDRIPPTLLKVIIDQISTPVAIFFNLSLKGESLHQNGKNKHYTIIQKGIEE